MPLTIRVSDIMSKIKFGSDKIAVLVPAAGPEDMAVDEFKSFAR